MKQVLIRGGGVIVDEVPAPAVGSRNILVHVQFSCISAGTELSGVAMSGLPLYRRALKQPENVRRTLEMMRDQGVKRTIDRVRGKLSAGTPTGYSAAGTVIAAGAEVEGFHPGDRVACAGAGIANHAEVIDVPVNLAVRIPAGLSTSFASTVTLGAIAMQGLRRTAPTLGENVLVVGLGVLGQITAQLLAANGCRVIGVDLNRDRIQLALENGLHHGIDVREESYVDRVLKLTNGFGADAAVVTAAASSDEVISQAMQACRKKGRVVLVGDVGLNLRRQDLYPKELDFLVSTSYGPGRYDPSYEEGGQDYPLPFVRWTENRNMEAYLQVLAEGKVRLDNLIAPPFAIDRADEAYDSLKSAERKHLIVLLQYPEEPELRRRVEIRSGKASTAGRIRVGLAGAGGFAVGMHLPNMVKLRNDFEVRAVMSRTGANAKAVATQFEARYATTDYQELLADPEIDLVLVATRHDLHGSLVLKALEAGKHVFVEKPLALTEVELVAIEDFFRRHSSESSPMLVTGFNRRFSPAIRRAVEILRGRTTPLIVNYRMNAGFLPPDHWIHGPEGGGRNLGEACHIYDLFRFLTGSAVRSIQAIPAKPGAGPWRKNDNFVATLGYEDGSVCTLTYTSLGAKDYPKERMEIFADGRVLSLDDYRSLSVAGSNHKGWSAGAPDKGQLNELHEIGKAVRLAGGWPIPLDEQLETSRVALHVERMLES